VTKGCKGCEGSEAAKRPRPRPTTPQEGPWPGRGEARGGRGDLGPTDLGALAWRRLEGRFLGQPIPLGRWVNPILFIIGVPQKKMTHGFVKVLMVRGGSRG
jgi:hypothetical protein